VSKDALLSRPFLLGFIGLQYVYDCSVRPYY